ncbi:CopG family transcriptional regulator [Microseira sp. BLCC-F43]|uniref:ribbon-helix-helix domain-containing protein n=1 Tax=Microseira sp. BLCC-F43 TaxID=3153602 RepID=UPI0035BB15A6
MEKKPTNRRHSPKTRTAKHGQTKIRYGFMLTEASSAKLDELAEKMGVSRSEVLELMIRRLTPSTEKSLLGKFLGKSLAGSMS